MLFKQLKFKSRIRKTAAIATIAVMLVTEAFAQQSGSARRPPAVQKAMDEAVIAAKKQDYATAIRLFSEALALAPRDSQIMLNLALAYNRLGKLPAALGWLRASIEADPSNGNANELYPRIAQLKAQLRQQQEQFLKQALRSVEQIDQHSEEGRRKYSEASKEIVRAQAQSGFYDEALQTLSGLKQLTGQERTDLEDVITVEQARVFALRGDVKSADNTFAQLHDPQFAVSGYWIDQINAPAKREYLNYSSRTMFWTRIARQLVNDDHCWAVDLDLYHQIMSWPEVGKFPQQDINGWFMVGGGTRVSADRINTGCERVAPLQLWTEFAQTICEKGWECNWSDAVKYASSQNDFVAVSSRLADVAKEIRGLVLAYEALDARTQRPRGK